MSNQMRVLGDRSLLPADDPYDTGFIEGVDCTLSVFSQRTRSQSIPNRLTYQITLNALQGLFTFLYTDGHAASAVSEIIDPGLTGSLRRIGLLNITPMEGSVDES